MKKILIINGSHRVEGSTKKLIEKIEKKLNEKNISNIEIIDLEKINIEYFNYENKYSKDDNYNLVEEKILNSDLIIFATPIYWYNISSKLKTLIDRFNEFIYNNKKKEKFQRKKFALIFTFASNDFDECFIKQIKLTIEYLGGKFTDFFGIRSKFPNKIREIDEKKLNKFIEKILK